MTMTCAIIDDEPLAAQQLENYVKNVPFLSLTGTFTSALTAMNGLRSKPVDLLLLDIQMPELSGLEFARLVPRQTLVVFTTAYPQYAIEGYKVQAFDFLLKPVGFDDFLAMANKAMEWHDRYKLQHSVEQNRYVFVKNEYRLQRVMLDDILYIEGVKDYVRLCLEDGRRIMSLINMKRLEELLPHPEFLRTHRSYIAHMSKVTTIDKQRILYGDVAIPISDNYKDDVMKFLEMHTMA